MSALLIMNAMLAATTKKEIAATLQSGAAPTLAAGSAPVPGQPSVVFLNGGERQSLAELAKGDRWRGHMEAPFQ